MMIFSLFALGASAAVNDCTNMKFDHCPVEMEQNGVLLNVNVPNVAQCQVYCKLQAYCKFFMFDKSDRTDGNCLLYDRPMDQVLNQCEWIATTVEDAAVCDWNVNTKRSACQRIYYGRCNQHAGVPEETEFMPSVEKCAEFCKINKSSQCKSFRYEPESQRCSLYSNVVDKNTCKYVYGPADTTLAECGIDESKWVTSTRFWDAKKGATTSGTANCPGVTISQCGQISNQIPDSRGSENFNNRETCEKVCTGNDVCKYFMWDDNAVTGHNCFMYKDDFTFKQHADACGQMGGQVYENNSTAVDCVTLDTDCEQYIDGDCYYTGNVIERVDAFPSPEGCARMCVVNKALCKAWVFTNKGKHCFLYDSDEKVCTKHYGAGAKTMTECGASYTATSRTGAKPDPGFDAAHPMGKTSPAVKLGGIFAIAVAAIASML